MLTPQDIADKEFRMSFRGYNTEDVDNFLQEIYDCFEEVYDSNRDLKERTGRLSHAVGQYKSMEDTLSNALNIAGKSADEIEACARIKADEIIRNAEITAQSIIDGAEQKIQAEKHRLETIKRETEIYKEKIVQLLNAQMCVLQEYPDSFSFGNTNPNLHNEIKIGGAKKAAADKNNDNMNVKTLETEENENLCRKKDNLKDETLKNNNIKKAAEKINTYGVNSHVANRYDANRYDANRYDTESTKIIEPKSKAKDNQSQNKLAEEQITEKIETEEFKTGKIKSQEFKTEEIHIDLRVNGDTATLPFVTQNPNGGYNVKIGK